MSNVFIIQEPSEGFDFANLHTYGEPTFVLPLRNSASLFSGQTMGKIESVMSGFDFQRDFILDAVGDRLNGYMVSQFLTQKLKVPSMMYLRWNRRESLFSPVEIPLL